MQTVRKRFTIILALLVLCTLAGCQEPSYSGENLDWIWLPNTKTLGVLSQTGYYYVNHSILNYADFAAGDSTILCYTLDCPHNHRSCDALIVGTSGGYMHFEQDHLYYIQKDHLGIHLYRRNNIGIELEQICTLGSKYMEKGETVEISGNCALVNGFLYYCGSVKGNVQDGQNGVTVKDKLAYIGCVNVKTGKEEIIVEEEYDNNLEMLMLCAVRENAVLFVHREGTDVDRDDPTYLESSRQSPMSLKQWSKETKEETVLFSKKYVEFSAVTGVAAGKVFYKAQKTEETDGPGATYSYNLDTEKEEFVCEETLVLLGDKYGIRANSKTGEYKVCDLMAGKELPNDIKKAPFIVCKSELGFVISEQIKDNPNSNQVKGKEYYYITYESLTDGLQETDLKFLYAESYS